MTDEKKLGRWLQSAVNGVREVKRPKLKRS